MGDCTRMPPILFPEGACPECTAGGGERTRTVDRPSVSFPHLSCSAPPLTRCDNSFAMGRRFVPAALARERRAFAAMPSVRSHLGIRVAGLVGVFSGIASGAGGGGAPRPPSPRRPGGPPPRGGERA